MSKSHDENRGKVCLICFPKKPKNQQQLRKIWGEVLERVKNYFLPDYDPKNQLYPTGICRNTLHLISQGKADATLLPKPANFPDLPTPTKTRQGPCACKMCELSEKNVVNTGKGHVYPI